MRGARCTTTSRPPSAGGGGPHALAFPHAALEGSLADLNIKNAHLCVVHGCGVHVMLSTLLVLVPCRRTLAAAAHPYGPEWCALMWPDYLKWLFRKHGSLEPRGEADCTICQRNRDGNIGKITAFVEMQCCFKKCVSPRRGLSALLCDGFLTLLGWGI